MKSLLKLYIYFSLIIFLVFSFSSLPPKTILNILLILKIVILLLKFRKSLREQRSKYFIRPILYIRISLQLLRILRSFKRNFAARLQKRYSVLVLSTSFSIANFKSLFIIDFQYLPFGVNSNSFKLSNFSPSISFLGVLFLTLLLNSSTYQSTLSSSLKYKLFYRIFLTSLRQQQSR